MEGSGARDVDDRSTPPLFHARQREAGQFGQGHHVQLHLGGDALRWQVGEVTDRPETRIVDQGVDFTGGQVGGQHGPGAAVGEVAGPGLHLDVPRRAYLGRDRIHFVCAAGHQDQVRPLPREFSRKTCPESTRGPRHNCPTCHGESVGVQVSILRCRYPGWATLVSPGRGRDRQARPSEFLSKRVE